MLCTFPQCLLKSWTCTIACWNTPHLNIHNPALLWSAPVAVHVKLCKHKNMHVHIQVQKQTHAHTQPPTFLKCLANFDITVCSLEFVEEGADFEFICDSLPKLRHDSTVLSRTAHLEDCPLAPLQPLRWWPVHHLVALDVLRLLFHLVSGEDGLD